MKITEPLDGGNLSDNVICPRCSTSLPPYALFCGTCGELIKEQKNEEGELRAKLTDGDVPEQKVDKTVRFPWLSWKPLHGSQLYRSLKSNGANGQVRKIHLLPQDIEAATFTSDGARKLISDETPESSLVSINNSAVTRSTASSWGWLPVLSLTSAIGVFLVALADNAGRFSLPSAEALWWFGLLVVFLPIAGRLFLHTPVRRERIALLIILGISLYLVKYFQYPLYYTFYDEFLNWRTLSDITTSGHLFLANPVTPIIQYYPGLEIVTNALCNLTGLSFFPAGIMLLGMVRLLFVLILYLLYEHTSNSEQVAGIATLLYIANPGFLYQDSEFGYESLALPLAVFVVLLVARRCATPAGHRRGLSILISLALGAVVITHHLTSYALVVFLLFWTAIWFLPWVRQVSHRKGTQQDQGSPGGAALLGLVLCVLWLIYTGDVAVGYAGPYFDNATQQLVRIVAGEQSTRQIFQSGSGFVLPLWERVTTLASVALILLGLPFGLWAVWRYHRTKVIMLALAGVALAYPVSLAIRLTPSGGELSNRSSEFIFLGVAIVMAAGATKFWLSRTPGWRRSTLLLGVAGVIFVGQLLTGNGEPWSRLPGPYLVIADDRSIEPEGITAAEWAGMYLGPGQRIVTDRDNSELMATYGNEWPVTISNSLASVFTSLQFGPAEESALQQSKIQFLVVDHRLSTQLPALGIYFNRGEPSAFHHTRPIDLAALEKFDSVENVSRVFDSGNIVIYDVEAIAPPPSIVNYSCTPASSAAVSSHFPKLAKHYFGTIYDIPTSLTTKVSLTNMQQKQGSFCGYITGFNGAGPIKGSITADGHIQFIAMSQAGQTLLTFDGVKQPDGTIAGSYCLPVAGICKEYGIWSLSPRT